MEKKDEWEGMEAPVRQEEPDSDPTHNYKKTRGARQMHEIRNLCAPLSIIDGIKWAELSPASNLNRQEKKEAIKARSEEWSNWMRKKINFDQRVRKARQLVSDTFERIRASGEEPQDKEEGPFSEETIFTMCTIMGERHENINFSIFTEPAPPIFFTENGPEGDTELNVDLLFLDDRARREPFTFYEEAPDADSVINHCLLIRNLHSYFGGRKTCRLCWRGCGGAHTCDFASCAHCHKPECDNRSPTETDDARNCDKCLKFFASAACYNTHKELSLCSLPNTCQVCFNKVKEEGQHTCYLKKCSLCKIGHIPWEPCYLGRDEKDEAAYAAFTNPNLAKDPTKIDEETMGNVWVADIECQVHPVTGEHVPVLLVAYKEVKGEDRDIWKVWKGANCIYEFVDEIIHKPGEGEPPNPFEKSRIFFHNVIFLSFHYYKTN